MAADAVKDEGEIQLMLPGIRILFAIVLLSVSVLIFGLGAAAFLRSAHENIASAPLWKPIETPMTARVDIAQPTLAMLRVEPEPQPLAAVPAAPAPVEKVEPVLPAPPAEAAAVTPAPEVSSPAPVQVTATPSVVEKPVAVPVTTVELPVQAAVQLVQETPAVAPQEPVREAIATPGAVEPKPEPTSSTVLAAVSTDKAPAETVAAPQAPVSTPALPAEALATPATEKPAAEKPAVATSTDTLKADDKTLDPTPTRVAALTESAADQGLAETKPLSPKEVKLPQPRVDPAIRDTHRRKLLEQQRARARVAQARRLAAARAAAQARANAATAASNPFGLPAPTGSN